MKQNWNMKLSMAESERNVRLCNLVASPMMGLPLSKVMRSPIQLVVAGQEMSSKIDQRTIHLLRMSVRTWTVWCFRLVKTGVK